MEPLPAGHISRATLARGARGLRMDDRHDADTLLDWCRTTIAARAGALRAEADPAAEQVAGYDLVVAAGRARAAAALLDAATDDTPATLALVAAGLAAADLTGRPAIGPEPPPAAVHHALARATDPVRLDAVGARTLAEGVPRPLDEDAALIRAGVREHARDRVAPEAQRIHREDADVPEWLIRELADLGCFGLSIPEAYGGSLPDTGDRGHALQRMLVVTEELSRASLGAAGSLITRPEMLAGALLEGGTEAQRQRWLPAIAGGDAMCAIAVTEPDHGSDVANLTTRARRVADAGGPDGDWVLDGRKTWCTFAGRADLILLLARTGAPGDRHRGLSLFVLEKPPYPGRAWTHEQARGGRLTARAIPTIGYRGMHSFDLAIDGLRMPGDAIVGGDEGEGRGFYLQMRAFATGRLQTVARATGVMQAALDEATAYVRDRHVFGVPLAEQPLTRAKVARMAADLAAARALGDAAALRHGNADEGDPGVDAALAKSMACAAAERVTREAQQLHGGMGYAEEYPVSRLFVDARVLSIFEGADEVLALKVILPRL
ncbi:acyl-CoA dehydrogenase family protein [Egibacter rhizosphaerae]|nr:acyl-CoA dehydrogenase family protein [Egibacter rhizosphaerae]